MGCSCSEPHTADHSHKANEVLASVGMKEVVEQGHGALEEAGRALEHLNRSERAVSLGFGSEVASIHADAAMRSNERAQEQIRTVIARIDHVLEGDDWDGHVKRVRKAFKEHDGTRKLVALRADVRLHLLEADSSLSANVAELTLASLDGAIKAASEGDLNQVVAHMRGIMDAALRGFESPEMGRQSIANGLLEDERGDGIGGASTGWCVALAACIAWAWSSFFFTVIVCMAIPFCWCCISPLIFATAMLHVAGCYHFLQPLCNAP
jgi:hypothetical protein